MAMDNFKCNKPDSIFFQLGNVINYKVYGAWSAQKVGHLRYEIQYPNKQAEYFNIKADSSIVGGLDPAISSSLTAFIVFPHRNETLKPGLI